MWIRCQNGDYLNLDVCCKVAITRDRSEDAGSNARILQATLLMLSDDGVVTKNICEGSVAECSSALQRVKDLMPCVDLEL